MQSDAPVSGQWCSAWLLIKLTLKGIVFAFLFFSFLLSFLSFFFSFLSFSFLFFSDAPVSGQWCSAWLLTKLTLKDVVFFSSDFFFLVFSFQTHL